MLGVGCVFGATKLFAYRRNNMKHLTLYRPFESIFPADIFDDFWERFDTRKVNQGFPKYDQYVDGGRQIIEVALAGYAKEQLSVEVDGNTLTIAANKIEDNGKNENRVIARRSFSKRFTDPTKAWDLNAADISFVDGLLKVVIPPTKPIEAAKKVLQIK